MATLSTMTWAVRKTRRWSKRSASTPPSTVKQSGGRAVAAWTQATKSTVGAMLVMSQAAATDWIQTPKFDSRVALQRRRCVAFLTGASREAGLVPPAAEGDRNRGRNDATEMRPPQ